MKKQQEPSYVALGCDKMYSLLEKVWQVLVKLTIQLPLT